MQCTNDKLKLWKMLNCTYNVIPRMDENVKTNTKRRIPNTNTMIFEERRRQEFINLMR
jgi:hypothetical protein